MSLCSASADLHTGYAHPHRTNDLQVIQNEVLQLCDATTLKKNKSTILLVRQVF